MDVTNDHSHPHKGSVFRGSSKTRSDSMFVSTAYTGRASAIGEENETKSRRTDQCNVPKLNMKIIYTIQIKVSTELRSNIVQEHSQDICDNTLKIQS